MTTPIPSPFFQPNPPPEAPKPKVVKHPPITVRIEIPVDWRFVLNILGKWIRGRSFVQKIEFNYIPPPKR